MGYEDFEIGDRVGRFYGDTIEKATGKNPYRSEQCITMVRNKESYW